MDVYFSFKQGFKVAVQSHSPILFIFERVHPKANPCNKFQEVPIMYHKRLGDKDWTYQANILNDPGPTFLPRDPRSTTD